MISGTVHAANKGQTHRAQLFNQLLGNLNDSEAS